MKSKDILNELRKEIDETKQKPFSREEVVILSRNEKIAIDNTILCLQEENAKLKKVIEILKSKTIIIFALEISKDLNDYNKMTSFEKLTQEEYDLLKEYLDD